MTEASRVITLTWADAEHAFNLKVPAQVEELEDKCGCGVNEVLNRLRDNRWKLADVRETVRIGLIGGGKTPDKALLLVKRYIDERPWAESVLVAQMILMAAIVGVSPAPAVDDEVKSTDG